MSDVNAETRLRRILGDGPVKQRLNGMLGYAAGRADCADTVDETLRWLYAACELEFELTGNSEEFGALVAEFDPESKYNPKREEKSDG